MYEQIPSELKALRQWVTWHEVPGDDPEKPAKVPCDPARAGDRRGNRSAHDPENWLTFEAACAAAAAHPKVAGVGFVFTDADPYTGVDFDVLEKGGQLVDWQRAYVQQLNSYVEWSPGGRGVHVIVRAELERAHKKAGIEIYPHGRFFTMTGNRRAGSCQVVRDAGPALAKIIAREFPNGGKANGGKPDDTAPIDEGDRNNRLTREAGRMRRAGMDPGEMEAALQAINERRCRPPLEEGEVLQIVRSVARYEKGPEPGDDGEEAAPLVGDAFSEDALALALVDRYPHSRHVAAWSRWYLWTGELWESRNVAEMYTRARQICREAASKLPEERRRESVQLKKAATVAAVERLARWDRRTAVGHEIWDRDPWLLNTPGGIVELSDGTVIDHAPKHYQTRITRGRPVDDWRAAAPRFAIFLQEITRGDDELAAYLQRIFGYACTGSAREHILPFLYGPGGNGKGTLLEGVAYALGDYQASLPEGFLAEQRGERHSTDLTELWGARLAYSHETNSGAYWNEARLKALTGGDRITARRVRQDNFSFDPTHTLILTGNNKPQIRSVDPAIRRRVQLVPLTYVPATIDVTLPEALRSECDGILSWAIAGAESWCEQGVAPPALVRDASDDYFASQDEIGEWIEACCHVGPAWFEPVSPLHASYSEWCEKNGIKPRGRKTFGDELEKAGFHRRRSGRTRLHVGLAIRPE